MLSVSPHVPRVPPCPQHFALLLKYVIQVAIPDIPAWVAEEMAKLEYQRREAFKVGPQVSPGGPQGLLGSPKCPQGQWEF